MTPRDRLLALRASLGCTVLNAADAIRSLAGNGRPDSLDAHFASVPRDVVRPANDAALAFAECCDAMDADAEATPLAVPKPLTAAALAHLRDTLADWHREVWTLADVELAEMTRGDA